MGFSGNGYSTASTVITSEGDLRIGNSVGAAERLAIGSSGKLLKSDGSTASWETISTADSTLTTQGDVLIRGASALARLGQSTSNYTLSTKGAGANPAWQASSTSTLTAAQDLLVASSANTLSRLAKGSDDQYLRMNGTTINWETVAASAGAWEIIANQDEGDDFIIGGETSTLFDDYKYIRVLGNFKQTGSNYVEFEWYDENGVIINNTQLYVWFEAAAEHNAYALTATQTRCGFIENGNTIFIDFLFQTQGTGTHHCVNWETNSSGNNAIAQFDGVYWIMTSDRLKGLDYSGLGTITAGTCSYKVLGLT